jgi:hypothetical protein
MREGVSDVCCASCCCFCVCCASLEVVAVTLAVVPKVSVFWGVTGNFSVVLAAGEGGGGKKDSLASLEKVD